MRKNTDHHCVKCGKPGVRCCGHSWLCAIHYRRNRMRNTAKARGLAVPSIETLDCLIELVISRQMKCECCGRTMVWLSTEKRGTTVSLQHDRSGAFRLICVSCNLRHRFHPGDTFYDVPDGYKRCGLCGAIKLLDDFHNSRNMWDGRVGRCKLCTSKMDKVYRPRKLT